MESDAKVWIAALRRSHDELAADVEAMTPDDLRARSGSREWDVSAVLSHLGSGAELALATLQAGLGGSTLPSADDRQAVWDRWNAMTPEVRARGFVESDMRHVGALEAIDVDTLRTKRIDVGFLPAPVDFATLVGFRLSEHALHSWDVRVAFHEDATVRSYASALLVDRMPTTVGFMGKADRRAGPPLTLAVRTTDPDRRFWLELAEKVRLGSEPRAEDGTLSLPAEALLRLFAGRLSREHTPAGVVVDGPLTLDDLRIVFPGF